MPSGEVVISTLETVVARAAAEGDVVSDANLAMSRSGTALKVDRFQRTSVDSQETIWPGPDALGTRVNVLLPERRVTAVELVALEGV